MIRETRRHLAFAAFVFFMVTMMAALSGGFIR